MALGAPENRLRGNHPDPWNLMRIIPTEERGMNIFLKCHINRKVCDYNLKNRWKMSRSFGEFINH